MRRTISTVAVTVIALVGAGPAWGQGDTGTHEVGHYLGALATFGGSSGPRGIVELQARPGQETRARGILIGLPAHALPSVRLALSDDFCGSPDAAYAPLGAPIEVRPDGTALLEEEGIFYARALRRAMSVAVLEGNPDRPLITGCTALQKFKADPSPRERDDVLLSAARLAAGPSLLGSLLADADGPAMGAAVLTGLTPGAQYGLVLDRGGAGGDTTCVELTAEDAVPLGSVVADPAGAAYVELESDALTSLGLRDADSLLVTLPGPRPGETVVAACAATQSAGVRKQG